MVTRLESCVHEYNAMLALAAFDSAFLSPTPKWWLLQHSVNGGNVLPSSDNSGVQTTCLIECFKWLCLRAVETACSGVSSMM